MKRFNQTVSLAIVICSVTAGVAAQSKSYPLETVTGLTLVNAAAEPVSYEGRRAVRLTISEESARSAQPGIEVNPLAVIQDVAFSSGVIEAEIAGAPAPNAGEGARGFVGIAFRMQKDAKTYDAFYLRPTNGRADDQVRRNHSTQYISHPEWTWQRLRKETPEKYEAYVDLVPGAWTKIKIEVRGEHARLFVHDQPQATLVVNDLKSGAKGTGTIALWAGPGTIAHFRNLTVTASLSSSSSF